MARFRHISTKLVLVLDAGTENGKKARKRVTISNIREDASTDALWELAEALGKLLAHPVAEVRLYKEEAVEREETDADAPENGGVQKEAVADNSQPHGEIAARADGGVQKGTDADNSQPGGENAAPAFGGSGKSGLLSCSCNDGCLKESRLSVFRPGSNRVLRASLRGAEGDAAIQYQTQPEYTRPPPLRENVENAKKRPSSICGFITDIIGRKTAVVITPAVFDTGSPRRCAARDDNEKQKLAAALSLRGGHAKTA